MTNENISLKEEHVSPIPSGKPPVIKKKFSNHRKKPIMHSVPFNIKYTCHACNQVGHLKYDYPFKHKSYKCIWVPKGTMTNNTGHKLVWVPKVSS